MQYIDKKNGEIHKVEMTSLSKIGGGNLDTAFRMKLEELLKWLPSNGAGTITIKIKVQKETDLITEQDMVRLSPTLSVTHPKLEIMDVVQRYITDEGNCVDKVDTNLFSDLDDDESAFEDNDGKGEDDGEE